MTDDNVSLTYDYYRSKKSQNMGADPHKIALFLQTTPLRHFKTLFSHVADH